MTGGVATRAAVIVLASDALAAAQYIINKANDNLTVFTRSPFRFKLIIYLYAEGRGIVAAASTRRRYEKGAGGAWRG
jgi:hypothetical protein